MDQDHKPRARSMIPENLSIKCDIGSMIQLDLTVNFASRCKIPRLSLSKNWDASKNNGCESMIQKMWIRY